MKLTPFHIAIQVMDIAESRNFYKNILGCTEGRSDVNWVDFDFFGHQFVCHLNPNIDKNGSVTTYQNYVDNHAVPVPHFGVILEMDQWEQLAETLKYREIDFIISPYTRFKGQPGEQATMFFLDPSGNALEFKAFKDMSQIFAIE